MGWLTQIGGGVGGLYVLKNRKGSRKWAVLKQDALYFYKLPSVCST